MRHRRWVDRLGVRPAPTGRRPPLLSRHATAGIADINPRRIHFAPAPPDQPYVTPGIGDFGVVAIPGHVGQLIRIGQWLNGDGFSTYEHAFIYVGDGHVVEGRPGGAGYSPVTAYPEAQYFSCPEEHRLAVANAAIGLVGTPYSCADYFALVAVRLGLHYTSAALRRYVSDSRHMICSQLVDEAYQRGGVQLFEDHRLSGDVTPGDLYRLVLDGAPKR